MLVFEGDIDPLVPWQHLMTLFRLHQLIETQLFYLMGVGAIE